MSKEQIYTHAQVKTEFTVVVGGLVKAQQLGLFLVDGPLLTNAAANVSGNPDAVFVGTETLESGAVRLVEGVEEGFVELEGSPDMVLEVVSTSSEHKDDVILRQAYWEAEIPEYWLVDVRKAPLRFDILRRTARGYVAGRKKNGWSKSAVFGESFRLTRQESALGHPAFLLEVR
jgi:Uma2 family endonuclease